MINVSVVFQAVSGHERVWPFLFLNECDIKENSPKILILSLITRPRIIQNLSLEHERKF